MIIIRNDTSIKRRGNIGKVLTYSGLAVMAISFLLSLRQTDDYTTIFIFVFLGLAMSQIGIPIFNRFGREPRIDQILDQALKGFDDRYMLIHYLLGSDHALLTPVGAFAIVPSLDKGRISYDQGEWIQILEKRRGTRRKTLKSLQKNGRFESESMRRSLQKLLDVEISFSIDPLYVFVHSDATIASNDSEVFATHIKKVKNALRRHQKKATIPSLTFSRVLETYSDHRV